MINLCNLPTELLIIILDHILQSRFKDIYDLTQLSLVNKRIRNILYSSAKYWKCLRLHRCSSATLGHASDQGMLEWITRNSLSVMSSAMPISNFITDLDLSHSSKVSSSSIIFILKSCPKLESLSCFNCPWVFPSELRVCLSKAFGSQTMSLNLKSFDIDFCGGASAYEASSFSTDYTRGSHPFRISGNSQLRLALNHSLSWSAQFYDICHIEYIMTQVCFVGSAFELNPHPCSTCHTQIARRFHHGSPISSIGICIRCEAREISQRKRSEYRIPVL